MSAHEMGKMGPLSRRGFLRTTAESVAAALVASAIAGCQTTGQRHAGPLAMLNLEEKKKAAIDPLRQVTADEGDFAVGEFLQHKLNVDRDNLETTLGTREDTIHGVQLMANGTAPDFIYMLVIGRNAERPENLPNHFSYTFGTGKDKIVRTNVPVAYRSSEIPCGHVRLGNRARYATAGAAVYGTAGWNICFNQQVVCMSAFHAISSSLTPNMGNPPWVKLYAANYVGTPPNNARLFYYESLALPPADNLFDLALAKFETPSDAETMVIQCSGGPHDGTRPWPNPPTGIVSSPVTGEAYHRIGAGNPNCGEGTLIGTGASRSVAMFGQPYILFRQCLVFEPFAGDGDSGAMMVRDSDNKTAGLHFTGTAGVEAISCRLDQLQWTQNINNCQVQVPGDGVRIIPAYTKP